MLYFYIGNHYTFIPYNLLSCHRSFLYPSATRNLPPFVKSLLYVERERTAPKHIPGGELKIP